jgi:hypothetical protein
MQSVGYLQVLPLLSDMVDERFLPPTELLVSTSDYGTLAFTNPSKQVGIVPLHSGYIVKQQAQDHALLHVGVVGRHEERCYDTACCIQQSQGGLISGDRHSMVILPYSLREAALAMRSEHRYDRMWKPIAGINRRFGIQDSGNLVRFFDRFQEELNQFEAQFEPVPGQIGAIILLDGEVVGVERSPSHAYWLALWPALIRGCYASLAMEYQQSFGDHPPEPKGRVRLRNRVDSLAALKESLFQAEEEMEAYARAKVRELITDLFVCTQEEQLYDFSLETVQHDQLTGQIVHEEGSVCYASLFVRKSWQRKRKWRDAKPFVV